MSVGHTRNARNKPTHDDDEENATQDVQVNQHVPTLAARHSRDRLAERKWCIRNTAMPPWCHNTITTHTNARSTRVTPPIGAARPTAPATAQAHASVANAPTATSASQRGRNDVSGTINAGNNMDVASELATLTDEDGKFTLTGLAPGYVALHALRATAARPGT